MLGEYLGEGYLQVFGEYLGEGYLQVLGEYLGEGYLQVLGAGGCLLHQILESWSKRWYGRCIRIIIKIMMFLINFFSSVWYGGFIKIMMYLIYLYVNARATVTEVISGCEEMLRDLGYLLHEVGYLLLYRIWCV